MTMIVSYCRKYAITLQRLSRIAVQTVGHALKTITAGAQSTRLYGFYFARI